MPAYLIAHYNVDDPEMYAEYQKGADELRQRIESIQAEKLNQSSEPQNP